MRRLSLLSLLLVCASCLVRVPRPPTGVTIAVKTTVRGQVRVEVPPPPPPPAVEIQGAAVVEFFGIPLEGAQDVVFVLDCSGSMHSPAQGRLAQVGAPAATPPSDAPPADGAPPSPPVTRKIDVAKAELLDALQRLPAGTRMNVIFFDSGVEAFASDLVVLEEPGREGLLGYVRERDAAGSTALAPAMRTAFLMNARRIVLLSDGVGNVGGGSREVLRDAREAMQGEVRIDTIGVGNDQDAELLHALATESGGLYQAL